MSIYQVPYKKVIPYCVSLAGGELRNVEADGQFEIREGALFIPLPAGKQLVIAAGHWLMIEQK